MTSDISGKNLAQTPSNNKNLTWLVKLLRVARIRRRFSVHLRGLHCDNVHILQGAKIFNGICVGLQQTWRENQRFKKRLGGGMININTEHMWITDRYKWTANDLLFGLSAESPHTGSILSHRPQVCNHHSN